MQGSKNSMRRLLLAGVSTALVLLGCEAQQLGKESAGSNQAAHPAKVKEEADRSAAALGAVPSSTGEAAATPAAT